MKYTQEEIKEMARMCIGLKSDQRYIPFIVTMAQFTGMDIDEIEAKIEDLAK